MRALQKSLSKIPLLIRVVSLYSMVALVSWGSGQLAHGLSPATPAVAQSVQAPIKRKVVSQQIISGSPVSFTINRLNINLPVRDGEYNSASKEWTLSTDAVYFATITSRPNDTHGSTFLYGHNQDAVIARMKNIQPGDQVVIKTSNGYAFTYSYVRDSVVAPDFTQALNAKSDTPQLTVMTCEGVWSETRRMMYFDLVEVS